MSKIFPAKFYNFHSFIKIYEGKGGGCRTEFFKRNSLGESFSGSNFLGGNFTVPVVMKHISFSVHISDIINSIVA